MKLEEEKALVEKIKNGDERAFERFYRMFFPKVYKYAYRKLKNREQAEDVTSETFFKALKSIKNFKSRENGGLDIWMYVIERNIIRDFFRKNAGVSILPLEEKWNEKLNPVVDDPYVTIEKEEIDRIVKDCLEELPVQYKNVLEMRFFKKMTLKEIATALDKSVGAVKVMQFRALKKLKELLEVRLNEQ